MGNPKPLRLHLEWYGVFSVVVDGRRMRLDTYLKTHGVGANLQAIVPAIEEALRRDLAITSQPQTPPDPRP